MSKKTLDDMLPIMTACYQLNYISESYGLNDGDDYTWDMEELLGSY